MSVFVCGYVLRSNECPGDEPEHLQSLAQIARGAGVAFRTATQEPLPLIVEEILRCAVPTVGTTAVPFLITGIDQIDSSESVIDVYDDLVGTTISLRDAVLRRLAPLTNFVRAAFASRLVSQLILVTSVGFDERYPRIVTTPAVLASAIADAYEREDQVPSLCAVVTDSGVPGERAGPQARVQNIDRRAGPRAWDRAVDQAPDRPTDEEGRP